MLDAGAQDFAETAGLAAPLALIGAVAQAQAGVVKVVRAAVLAFGEQAGAALVAAVAQEEGSGVRAEADPGTQAEEPEAALTGRAGTGSRTQRVQAVRPGGRDPADRDRVRMLPAASAVTGTPATVAVALLRAVPSPHARRRLPRRLGRDRGARERAGASYSSAAPSFAACPAAAAPRRCMSRRGAARR